MGEQQAGSHDSFSCLETARLHPRGLERRRKAAFNE